MRIKDLGSFFQEMFELCSSITKGCASTVILTLMVTHFIYLFSSPKLNRKQTSEKLINMMRLVRDQKTH